MSYLDIFFQTVIIGIPIIGSMDICLKLPKSLEFKHDLFMMGHIKNDFKNFGNSQLFSK